MKRKEKIIGVLVIIIVLISIITLVLIYKNSSPNLHPKDISPTDIVSYINNPQIQSSDNNVVSYIPEANSTFYYKYNTSQMYVIEHPVTDTIYSHFFNFGIKKINGPFMRVILVDASQFKTSKEVYERVEYAQSMGDSLVSTRELKFNNLIVSMAILKLPSDGREYRLAIGIKDENKGYFFETDLVTSNADIHYTQDELDNFFSFTSSRTPQDFLNIIEDIVYQNIPQNYFKPYRNDWPISYLQRLKKDNNGLYPSTF